MYVGFVHTREVPKVTVANDKLMRIHCFCAKKKKLKKNRLERGERFRWVCSRLREKLLPWLLYTLFFYRAHRYAYRGCSCRNPKKLAESNLLHYSVHAVALRVLWKKKLQSYMEFLFRNIFGTLYVGKKTKKIRENFLNISSTLEWSFEGGGSLLLAIFQIDTVRFFFSYLFLQKKQGHSLPLTVQMTVENVGQLRM